MESKLPITSIELTRQEHLELWMRRSGWTYKALGELMGMTGVNAAKRLKSDTIPPSHHEIWVRIIPSDLLPQPVYQKPGPKPKSIAQVA